MRKPVLSPAVRRALSIITVVLLAAVALGAALWWWNLQRAEARRVVFVIPPGTAARIAAGDSVEALPRVITMTLGVKDTLIIQNDDQEAVWIGSLFIGPGQRFVQQFHRPRIYDFACTAHESGQLRIVVTQ